MAEYISRDALMDAILELPPKMDEDGYGWLGRRGVWQMVADFPAADVVPVRHGRWKKVDDGIYYHMECSVCGCRPLRNIWVEDDELSLYCPNCGADMREVEHD